MRPALPSCFLAGILLIPACSEDLATLGPTPPGEGVTIYIHANFVGSSQALNVDVPDFNKVEGPCVTGDENGQWATWSDCISSIRVAEGWSATLFRDRDFKGRSVTVTADTPNLLALEGPCDDSFNDCVSSIRVFRR